MKKRLKITTKNSINQIRLLVLVAALALSLSGCGKKGPEKFGQEISNPAPTEIKAILRAPTDFDGKNITVQGKMIRECPTGCWFEIQQGTAILYVDINPSGFAIPQKVGKTVLVEGKLEVKGNQPVLVGTGVEIK